MRTFKALLSYFAFSLVITGAIAGERRSSPLDMTSLLRPVTPSAYDVLKDKADKIESANSQNGWAYIVSGGIAVGISIPAYFLTDDIFARTVYSLGETLGVASVGYGSYLVLVNDDYTRFARILAQSNLTVKQRDELSLKFLEENAKRAKSIRKIRVITHSLTAGLNVMNGLTTSNRELKSALFFLGGINLLATVHFIFSESEEETFYRRVANRSWDIIIPQNEGVGLALRLRF